MLHAVWLLLGMHCAYTLEQYTAHRLTVCARCRAAVLLERQVVIFCPNIGVLTSSVLALIPLVRPYAWQSLLLPVLPATEQMLDFLQVRFPATGSESRGCG